LGDTDEVLPRKRAGRGVNSKYDNFLTSQEPTFQIGHKRKAEDAFVEEESDSDVINFNGNLLEEFRNDREEGQFVIESSHVRHKPASKGHWSPEEVPFLTLRMMLFTKLFRNTEASSGRKSQMNSQGDQMSSVFIGGRRC